MARINKNSLFAMVWMAVAILSCSDDSNIDDQDPGPGGPGPGTGGTVTISGVSSGYRFWGDEIEINGTGFSTVKEENIIRFTSIKPVAPSCEMNYTSETGGDITIISATATKLRIQVPVKMYNTIVICGPEAATIEVTVQGSKATLPDVTFSPLPYADSFLYHYGWFDHPGVTRIGDSVMMAGGLRGTQGKASPLWDKIRLTVNGKPLPIKFRSIGLESGWAFYLSAEDFGEINCEETEDGWNAREMDFTFSLEGTDKSATSTLRVQYLPTTTAYCTQCTSYISKSAGGNPTWSIGGKDMYYNKVRFTPLNCGGTAQEMDINASLFTDQVSFAIPLSILSANCSYGVTLVDACGEGKSLDAVNIIP